MCVCVCVYALSGNRKINAVTFINIHCTFRFSTLALHFNDIIGLIEVIRNCVLQACAIDAYKKATGDIYAGLHVRNFAFLR